MADTEQTGKDDPLLPARLAEEDGAGLPLPQRVAQPPGSRLLAAATAAKEKVCTKKFLLARLPILAWLPVYDQHKLLGDVIAGVTTALTVIPQGIGYAPLAGLPLQYGLYASIVPGLIYCFLGTTKETTVGPTAVNSLMSYNYAGGVPYKAITLAFFAGLIEILAGLFNLGFLIQFISSPVITAFSSAVSIQVITSQVKGFFGIKFKGRGFVQVWVGIFKNIQQINFYDALVGLISMAILYFLKRLKEFAWCEGSDKDATRTRFAKKFKWLLSISANCLVVVVSSVFAWFLVHVMNIDVLNLTGEVDSGLPAWQLPWQFNRNSSNATDWEGPLEIAGELRDGLIMVPLVSILQHLAIAKHYAGDSSMAASQEMIALGACQFVGSFTGSMAITASFGRSAVNAFSGVRTTMGGVVTGLIIIFAAAILSPYLAFIPTGSLSAVIMFAMFYTIDYELPKKLWASSKLDLLPYSATFFIGLFANIQTGLICGIVLHAAILLQLSSQPAIAVEHHPSHTVVRPSYSLLFPAVDRVRRELGAATLLGSPVILDLGRVRDVDYTAGKGVSGLVGDREDRAALLVCGANKRVQHCLASIHGTGFKAFSSVEEALSSVKQLSTTV